MRRSKHNAGCPSGRTTTAGICYLLFMLFLLPSGLYWINDQLNPSLSETELNFVFYLVNFISILLIFHDFLGRAGRQVLQEPFEFLQAVILGFVAYYACNWVVTRLVGILVPGFTNYNDASIAQMLGSNYLLMFVGTVILVPPVEECLYRGLIFRNLYGKSPAAAYTISILAFAAIHILGYIGNYSALELLMAVLQYLPAGLCLAWAYTKSDTIFAPMVIHAAINYISITNLR